MAIVQISKIQVRTGNEDDLPQLSPGEIGFCTDTRRAFIGNDPNLFPPANNYTTTQTELLTDSTVIGAAGANTYVQFNSNDVFGASPNFTFSVSNNFLQVSNARVGENLTANDVVVLGNLVVNGNFTTVSTSNTSIVDPVIQLNVPNGGPLTADRATGVQMLYYPTNPLNSAYVGWSGPNANVAYGGITPNSTYGLVSNTILFGSSPTFDVGGNITSINAARTMAGTIILTGAPNGTPVATSLVLLNDSSAVISGNLQVNKSANIANGAFQVTTTNDGNIANSSININQNTFVNIGGIEFRDGNATLPAGGTFTGNFAGNVSIPPTSNLATPTAAGAVLPGGLLFNDNGNIAGTNNIVFSNSFLTLNNTNLAVNGTGGPAPNGTSELTSDVGTLNLFNANVSNVNAFGDATNITMGAPAGTFTINNPTINGDPNQVNLFGTTSNITFGATATDINIGPTSPTSNTNVNNQLVVNSNARIQNNIYLVNSFIAGTGSISSNTGQAAVYGNGLGVFQNATVNTLFTGQNANLSGQLNVSGNTTVSGNIIGNTNLSISNDATVGRNLSVSGDFRVTNAAAGASSDAEFTFNADISVLATAIINRVETTSLNAGTSAATTGTITGNWSLGSGSRLQATYADLAECYNSDRQYEPGTVLVFGGDLEVTESTTAYDSRVAGIVSSEPAYVMNMDEFNETRIEIALVGRVPCKVLGPVNKGDVLVTSNIAGTAQAIQNGMYRPGTVIGKALESIETNDVQMIEVAVGRF